MSNTVRLLVGIGCLAGLVASFGMNLDFWLELPLLVAFVVDAPWSVALDPLVVLQFLLMGAPLGYLLVGWNCARHWKGVSQHEALLVGGIALLGTTVTITTLTPTDPGMEVFPPSFRVILVGFWMLNGFGLAWLLRKLRRIMRKANAE